ncbi:MAG: T9SS type A sorting domain-containing protein, partial [Bacteroidota bacterium]
LSGVNFPVQAKTLCPYLKVDVSSGLFNCDELTYTVSYCNKGTTVAEDAYVIIDLDDKLDYGSSSIPLIASTGNLYRFELGDIDLEECGSFEIHTPAIEDCNLYTLGTAYQVEAKIYPDSLCVNPDPDWSRASIKVTGTCDELTEEVKFQIENVGGGDMIEEEQFIVTQEDLVFFQSDYQLPIGQAKNANFNADGTTYRIIVYNPDGHPGNSYATVAVEGCGTDAGGDYSTGYVTQFPEADQLASVSKDVQESVENTDGTILRGFPKGYGEEHFIPTVTGKQTDLTYHIQFQNEGQRNVKRVVIRDTLSPYLDVQSIIPGTSSHPYTYEVYGEGIVKFTFDNLDLPSSSVGAIGSKGFLKFRVSLLPNISNNTRIVNKAAVYMGYQKPIVSNEVFHTVGGELEDFVTVVISGTEDVLQSGVTVNVAPNPFADFTTIMVDGLEENKLLSFILHDTTGKVIRQEQFAKNRFTFYRNALTSGMYFYKIEVEGQLLNAGKVLVK